MPNESKVAETAPVDPVAPTQPAPVETTPDTPEPLDHDFHAKALYAVLAQSMRVKGHRPPEWNALPPATQGTWVTAVASVPTK